MSENLINLKDADTGEIGSVPESQVKTALSQGYEVATPEEAQAYSDQQKFGGFGQQALGMGEEAARSATFGASTLAEKGLSKLGVPGLENEDILGRERSLSGAQKVLSSGFGLGTSLLTGVGEGALLEKVGQAAIEATGLTGAEGLAKIGSSAVKSAAETALFNSGEEANKAILQDPDQNLETAAINIGLGGVLGGAGVGAALGSVSPLWNATAGPKLGSLLKFFQDKMGGIEGQIPDEIQNAIESAGVPLPPEVRASFSNDPQVRQMFQTLQDSATSSGVESRESLQKVRAYASDLLVKSLGKNPEDLSQLSELSPYEAGKKVQDALHQELKAQSEPISEIFDQVRDKFKGVSLKGIDQDQIQESIGKLIQEKGYYLSESSPQAKLVTETLKDLGGLQTLEDISKYTSILNEKTQDPSLWKVGGDLRKIFRNAESNILTREVQEKAPELLQAHSLGRVAYQDLMETVDQLNDRLHVGKYRGPGSFLTNLKEMAPEDVLRRMSGKSDADLLSLIQEKFPAAAQAVKDYHVDNLLKTVSDRAPQGQSISTAHLFTALDKMTPELKDFAFPEAGRFSVDNKVDSIRKLLEAIPQKVGKSGTPQGLDALMSKVPGSAVAMAAIMTGHNPLAAVILSPLVKLIGRDIPDAVRLSMLKFIGSNKQIDSEAFKSMVEFAHATMRGENLLNRATKSLLKGEAIALPSSLMPSEKSLGKLDDRLKEIQTNPMEVTSAGGKLGHYLPEHATSLGTTATRSAQYLNSLRPNEDKASPLDSAPVISAMAKARFQNALTIAHQPLLVLESIRKGTLTREDVSDLQNIYPSLYQKMNHKILSEITSVSARGDSIPYATRLNLSLFMASPLDSTMTPQAIQMLQMKPAPSSEQQQRSMKPSMAPLSKLPGMNQTSSEARELARLK